jgi:N-methylhydantoinase B/oxoprolinase/acetone carboxylase alpha subunit
VTLTDANMMIEIVLCGGSGYGDPSQRDRTDEKADIDDGYVSESVARGDLAAAE